MSTIARVINIVTIIYLATQWAWAWPVAILSILLARNNLEGWKHTQTVLAGVTLSQWMNFMYENSTLKVYVWYHSYIK